MRRALALLIVFLVALSGVATAQPAQVSGRMLPVPHLTIYPGDRITGGMLVDRLFHPRAVARIQVHDSRQLLEGKVARRTLLPGQPILANAVREPDVVAQGKPCLIVFQSGGLTITSYAVALQSGGVGEMISLRNPDSGAIIRGIVRADGTISVGGP
jgi:flagellar basal body P-ring formation protein FlgA